MVTDEALKAVERHSPLHGASPTLLSCAWCRTGAMDTSPKRVWKKKWTYWGIADGYELVMEGPSEESIDEWFASHEGCSERARKEREEVGFR